MSSDEKTALGNGRIRLQNSSQPMVKPTAHPMSLSPKGKVWLSRSKNHLIHIHIHLQLSMNLSLPFPESASVCCSSVCLFLCLFLCLSGWWPGWQFSKKVFVCNCLCIFLRAIVFCSVKSSIDPSISAPHLSLLLYLPQCIPSLQVPLYTSIISTSLGLHSSALCQHHLYSSPKCVLYVENYMFKAKLTNCFNLRKRNTEGKLPKPLLSIHVPCQLDRSILHKIRFKYLSRLSIHFLSPPKHKFWNC